MYGLKQASAHLECLANHLDSEVHRCTFDVLQRKLVYHQLCTVSLENPVHVTCKNAAQVMAMRRQSVSHGTRTCPCQLRRHPRFRTCMRSPSNRLTPLQAARAAILATPCGCVAPRPLTAPPSTPPLPTRAIALRAALGVGLHRQQPAGTQRLPSPHSFPASSPPPTSAPLAPRLSLLGSSPEQRQQDALAKPSARHARHQIHSASCNAVRTHASPNRWLHRASRPTPGKPNASLDTPNADLTQPAACGPACSAGAAAGAGDRTVSTCTCIHLPNKSGQVHVSGHNSAVRATQKLYRTSFVARAARATSTVSFPD
eukprot:COSAG02_NODE_29_length_51136_cov_346.293317_11_plen_315_part_00